LKPAAAIIIASIDIRKTKAAAAGDCNFGYKDDGKFLGFYGETV
jgi:hypothetical protein